MEIDHPLPTTTIFEEGLAAREAGRHASDNPYCVGTEQRAEWAAGFRAMLDIEDEE